MEFFTKLDQGLTSSYKEKIIKGDNNNAVPISKRTKGG